MDKKMSMTAALAIMALIANAETLTPEQAWERAASSQSMIKKAAGVTPKLLLTVNTEEQPTCYVFSNPGHDKGFVLLSADDSAMPVLGYSESGTLDTDNMPDNFKYWLDFYGAEIAYGRQNQAEGAGPTMQGPARKSINPLCKTKWNQDAPYNAMCPIYQGRHLYTGCVATAVSQAMKYHNWPEKAQGKIIYTTGTLKLPVTVDLSELKLDWDNMLDDYPYGTFGTAAQRDAVAELMMGVGAALRMDYKEASSSAYSANIPGALIDNFGYGKQTHLALRNFYSKSDWEELIYNNLVNSGPVIYSGMASDGSGHEFIVDGYNDGYFHLNWGWGGMSDGYFLLSALDPMSQGIGGASTGTYGFVYDQDVILDMRLPQAGEDYYYEIYMRDGFKLPASARLGQGVAVTGYFYSGSNATIESGTLGLLFTGTDGNTKYMKGMSISGLGPNMGNNRNDVILPTDLAAGKYIVRPGWVDANYEQHIVDLPYNMPHSYTAEVADGRVTFTVNSLAPADVTVKGITVNGETYAGMNVSTVVTFANTGETEFFGTVKAGLFNTDAKNNTAPVYKGADAMIDIEGGETCEVEYNSVFRGSKEGTYTLRFYSEVNGKYTWMGEGATVTLKEAPPVKIVATDFGFANGSDTAGKSTDVEFTYKVSCESGMYSDVLYIGLGKENDTYFRKVYEMPYVSLQSGESIVITMSETLPSLFGVGTKVKAELSTNKTRKVENIIAPAFYFTIVDPSGITDVETGAEVVSTRMYNLQGVEVPASTTAPGHYILVTLHADGTTTATHILK